MGNTWTPRKRISSVFSTGYFYSESLEDNSMKYSLFGIPLEEAVMNSESELIPKFLESAIEYLDIKGHLKTVDLLQTKIEFGEFRNFANLPPGMEKKVTPYEVASFVTRFLSKLPEPLLGSQVKLDSIFKDKTGEESFEIVKNLVHTLPECNFATLQLFIDHLNRVVANSMKNGNTRERLLEHILKGSEIYIPVFHILMDYSDVIFEKGMSRNKSVESLMQPTIRDLHEAYVFNEIKKTSIRRLAELATVDRKDVLSEGESSDDEEQEINKYNSLMNMFRKISLQGFEDDDDSESDVEEKDKKEVALPTMDDEGEWEDTIPDQKLTPQQQIAKDVCKMEYAREKTKKAPVINTFDDDQDESWD